MEKLITLGIVAFFLFLGTCAVKLALDTFNFKNNRLPAIERQLQGID